MKMFEGKCPECGKKVFLTTPDGKGFCNRFCETNYKFRQNRMYKKSVYEEPKKA